MAKKRPNKIKDDFDLDGDLDSFKFDDFDFDASIKDDRKPITKLASGAKDGFKRTVVSKEFLKRAIKDTLPSGYGEAADFADTTAQSLQKLYDDSAREIKPAWNATKKTVARTIPADSKYIPKKIKNLLEKWRKEENAPGYTEPSRESQMEDVMKDIFQAQSAQAQQDKAEADTRDRIKEGIAELRFNSVIGAVNAAAVGVAKLDAYNTNINFKYQKRSLELQYRQLFVMQDMLKLQGQVAEKNLEALAVIAKNTGLPDALKIRDAEARNLVFRNKLYESIAGGLYGARNRYIERLTGGVRDKAVGGLRNLAGGVLTGLAGLESAKDAASMGDKYVMGGDVVGSLGTEFLGRRAGQAARKKLEGSSLYKRFKIKERGANASAWVRDLPNRLNEFKNDQSNAWDPSLKGWLISGLQSLLPDMGVDNAVKRYRGENMLQPSVFTRRSDKSINEVIPGYLARIFRELQVIRTGNDKLDLTVYDHDKGRFTSKTKLAAAVKSSMVNQSRKESLRRDLGDIMAMIDPENKLSADQRREVHAQLLNNSASVLQASEQNLASSRYYSDKNSAAISAHMRQALSSMDEEKRLKFIQLHHGLASALGDPRAWVQQQIDLGNEGILRQMGVFNSRGDIDLKKVQAAYLNFQTTQTERTQAGPRQNAGGYAFGQMARDLAPSPTLRQRAASAAESIRSAAWEVYQDPKGYAKRQYQSGMDAVSPLVDKAKGYYDNTVSLATDVFIEGENHPRIRKALLQAGVYRNQISGTVVKALDDIREPIVDEQGNVIVTRDELPKLIYYKGQEKIRTYLKQDNLKYWSAAASDRLGQGRSYLQNVVKVSASNFMRELTSRGADVVDEPTDIYVDGEESPRLLGVKMQQGHYVDAQTNETISKPSDIKGAVRSLQGELLVADDEIKNLRVYNKRTGSLNPFSWLGSAVGWLGRAAWKYQTKVAPKWAAKNLKILAKTLKLLGSVGYKVTNATVGAAARSALGLGKARRGPLDIVQDLYSRLTGRIGIVGQAMKAGKYFSEKSQKIISSLAEIDGPIRHVDTNQLAVTQEDYEAGMVDAAGNPVNFKARVYGAAKNMGTTIGSKLTNAVNAVRGKVREAANLTDDEKRQRRLRYFDSEKLMNNVRGNFDTIRRRFGLSRQEATAISTEKVLTQIRDALSPRKRRRNSYEQLLEEQNAEQAKKASVSVNDKNDAAPNGKTTDSKSFAEVFGFDKLIAALGAGKDILSGLKGMKDLFTKGGKLLKLGGAAAAAAEGAAAIAGTGAAAAGATGAATTAATAAAGAAGGSVMAAIGSGLLAAGGFTLSVLTSPVTLGIAATALAGYGIYKGYKYYTRGKVGALTKLRLVQYGFKPDDEARYLNALDMEKLLDPAIKRDPTGALTLDWNVIKLSEVMAPFGLDFRNSAQANNFMNWLKFRFAPVYLTHLTALKAIKGSLSLSDVDDLKGEDAKKFFEAAKFPEGPYTVALPYSAEAKVASSHSKDVTDAYAAVELSLKANAYKRNGTSAPGRGQPAKKDTPAKVVPPAQKTIQNAANVPLNQLPASPDAEHKPITVGGLSKNLTAQANGAKVSTSATGLKSAGGPVVDGRNAGDYLKLKPGVNLDQVNPQLKKQFFGMIEEYGRLTGKPVTVIDGFRTAEEQARIKQRLGDKAADPGSSLHEFGLALDVDPAALNHMESMGLIRKYGFTRPVGREPWHLEPIGIQTDLSAYKNNPLAAARAIESGLGKGGGGTGTMTNVPQNVRSVELSKNIMQAAVASDPVNISMNNRYQQMVLKPTSGTSPSQAAAIEMARPTSMYQRATRPDAAAVVNQSANRGYDGEAKPAGGGTSAPVVAQADPQAKVPAASGDGYNNLKDTIVGAAKQVGVDPNLSLITVAAESDFRNGASPGTSTASGIGQFTASTWREMMDKHAARYGLDPNTPPTDPKAASLMLAAYYKENISYASNKVSRPIGLVEAYILHFLGPGGGVQFLNLLERSPDAIAAQAMPKAAAANASIFYDKTGRPRTVSEIYALLSDKLAKKASQYGINASGVSTLASNTSTPSLASNMPMPTPMLGTGRRSFEVDVPDTPAPMADQSIPMVATPATPGGSMATAYGLGGVDQSTMVEPTPTSAAPSTDVAVKSYGVLSNILGVLTDVRAIMQQHQRGVSQPSYPTGRDGMTAQNQDPSVTSVLGDINKGTQTVNQALGTVRNVANTATRVFNVPKGVVNMNRMGGSIF